MENNNTENNNWIRTYIIDVLPCITIAVFALAYRYLSSFYHVFGIDIINYSTFGDILLRLTAPLISLASGLYMASIISIDMYRSRMSQSLNLGIRYNWYSRFIVKFIKIFQNSKLTFLVILIYFWTLLIFVMLCIEVEIFTPTIFSSAISLIYPLIVLFAIWGFSHFPIKKAWAISQFNKKWLFAAFFLIYYFLYALPVFSYLGRAYGEKTKEEGIVKFEIRTTNGTVYTDKDYYYIDRMSENVFLSKKNTGEAVVLREDGLEFTKLVDKRPKDNDIIENIERLLGS